MYIGLRLTSKFMTSQSGKTKNCNTYIAQYLKKQYKYIYIYIYIYMYIYVCIYI